MYLFFKVHFDNLNNVLYVKYVILGSVVGQLSKHSWFAPTVYVQLIMYNETTNRNP